MDKQRLKIIFSNWQKTASRILCWGILIICVQNQRKLTKLVIQNIILQIIITKYYFTNYYYKILFSTNYGLLFLMDDISRF
jgi:hypothetical protein